MIKSYVAPSTPEVIYNLNNEKASYNPKYTPNLNAPPQFVDNTIYQKQIDTYKTDTGQRVPIYETFVNEGGKERLATPKESDYYKSKNPDVLSASKEKKKIGSGGMQEYLSEQRSKLATERARAGENVYGNVNIPAELLVGVGTSGVNTGLFFKNLITQPVEIIKNIPSGVEQTVGFIRTGGISNVLRYEPAFASGYIGAEVGQQLFFAKAGDFTLFGRTPKQVEISSEFAKEVSPFTRQRATLILTDEKGNYILGQTKSGDIISIGGGIEKGQTTKQAVLSELYQETGLTSKDIKNLKSRGNIVTTEETFKVYTATIPDKALRKIVPSSDVQEIKIFSPTEITSVTGQTAKYPIKLPSGIRSYEAGIINWLETGKKPTLLKATTKQGEFYLGTQSRYNVPYSSQKLYLGGDNELLFASGTTEPAKLNRFYNPLRKKFEIMGSKTKRGQAEGLYLQPPVSAKEGSAGYVGLSYVGFGEDVEKSLGITFKKPKRVVYTLKEKPISPIVPTPKTLSGAESELIITPETWLRTTGRSQRFKIEGKRVFFQPLEIIKDSKTAEQIVKLNEMANTGTQIERLRALKKLSSLTGIDYLQGQLTYIPLAPITARTTIPLFKNVEEIPKEKSSAIEFFITPEPIRKEKVIEFSIIPTPKSKEIYSSLEIKETRLPKYFDPEFKKEKIKALAVEEGEEKRKRTIYEPPNKRKGEEKKFKTKEFLKDIFDVFIKEKGVFTKKAEAATPYLAGKKAKELLFKGLQASAQVRRRSTKELIKAKELGLDFNFREGKKNAYTLIQRKGGKEGGFGRLQTQPERREIQFFKMARKNKGNLKKRFNIWS